MKTIEYIETALTVLSVYLLTDGMILAGSIVGIFSGIGWLIVAKNARLYGLGVLQLLLICNYLKGIIL